MIETDTLSIETLTMDIEKKRKPGGIEMNGLEVYYGSSQILKGINLVFPPGKVTAIIGPSGCGKTTLLRCLNRLSELAHGCKVKGEILLDNEDIFKIDPMLLRRRVGMVFQKPNPFPKSIRENVLYGVKALKLDCDHDAYREILPGEICAMGRTKGQATSQCFCTVHWTAAAFMHRPQFGRCTGGNPA